MARLIAAASKHGKRSILGGRRKGRRRPSAAVSALLAAFTLVGAAGVATTLAPAAAAASGITLTNAVQLTEFPGNGGALTSEICPAGYVMVGLNGSLQVTGQATWITAVVTVCSPLGVSGGVVAPVGTTVLVGAGGVVGGAGIGAAGNSSSFSKVCPANQAVVGFEAWYDSSGNTSGVHGYQIACSALDASGVPVGSITTLRAGVVAGTDSTAQLCPPVSHAGTPGGVGAGYAGAAANPSNRAAASSLWCAQVQLQSVAPPALTATLPTSPANNLAPAVVGTTGQGTTVSIYANATCQGSPVATGSASALAAGITVPVPADATTSLSATATINGLTSDCSNALSYLEDSTPPSLNGAATTQPDQAGWYAGNVTVHWTCSDAGSGIATCPADATLTGEGSNLSTAATATDHAGNSTTQTVSGIKIDRTPPTSIATIAGNQPTGWYNALPLTVTLSALDNLSGVSRIAYSLDGTPATVSGSSGSVAISATGRHTLSMSATDLAGNVEPLHSVTIDVDVAAPALAAAIEPAPIGVWNDSAVQVSLTCSDQVLADGSAGSGIAACSLGAGSAATANSDGSQTASLDVTTEGRFHLTGTASDVAGNTSSLPVPVNIDRSAPAVTAAPDRGPDHTASDNTGWYTAPVSFTFSCSDPALADGSAGSGTVSCPGGVTLGSDGAHQSVAGTAYDLAGNSGVGGASGINIDQTGPTVAVTYNGEPTKKPWYDGPVTLHFSCTDATSGVEACPADVTVATEGSNQSVSVSASDAAGNSTPVLVNGINIDLTRPQISGELVPAPNGNGWNDSDVTVEWHCVDPTLADATPGSGVADCPPSQIVSTEGSGQILTATATDVAGNTSEPARATVNLDKTPPVLAGTPTTAPNGTNGWYTSPVTIHWTASDALSGIDDATVPADSTLSSDGVNSTYAATVLDLAGNSTTASSTPVNIDQTPPSTAVASAPASWSNSGVTLDLVATDNLSGVAATHFSVDGAAQQTGTTVSIDAEGRHQVSFYSVDDAGNAESPTAVTVDIDKTAPTVVASQAPAANANGWNNGPVTVTFSCTDPTLTDGTPGSGLVSCTSNPLGSSQFSDDGESGTAVVTVSGEGADQPLSGSAADRAGNTGSASTAVSIDTTPPTISGGPVLPANSNGWYNQPVDVAFTCADPAGANGTAGSGVATCDNHESLDTDGAGQSVTGNVTDLAGNAGSATVSGLNLDQAPPLIAPSVTPSAPNGSNGWYRTPVTVHFAVSDGLSGIDPATVPPDVTLSTDGANQDAGASVADLAGNQASATTGKAINIDRTAPTVTFAQSVAAPNANGWYDQPVTVTFTCTDATSGVAAGSCPSQESLTTGKHAAQTFTVHDVAGNTTTVSVPEIDVDTVGPVITFTGNAGAYTVDQTVSIGCTASDNLSGIDTAHTTCPSVQAPAYSLAVGQATVLHATATDLAGNLSTNSTSFTIGVSCSSLVNLVNAFANNASAANGLTAKISAACSAPNSNAKAGVIGAFDNQVRALTGKVLTSSQADYLTRFAGLL